MLKRVVFSVLGLMVLVIVLIGGILAKTFSGNMAMPAAGKLPGSDVALIPDGYVAVYAVPTGPGKVALIDCGNDPEARAVKDWLAAEHQEVEAILVTHGHPDHLGGCKALPKAPIYAMAAEAELMKGEIPFQGPLPKLMGPTHLGVVIDHPLHDNDHFTVGETEFTAFALPGHTPGSAAYLAHGVLIFGNAATGTSEGAVKNAPWIFSDNVEEALASLHALVTRLPAEPPIELYAVAHSGPVPADPKKLSAAE